MPENSGDLKQVLWSKINNKVAIHLNCDGIFNDRCTRLLLIPLVKEFLQVAHLSQGDRATHKLLRFAKLQSGIFEPPFLGEGA